MNQPNSIQRDVKNFLVNPLVEATQGFPAPVATAGELWHSLSLAHVRAPRGL